MFDRTGSHHQHLVGQRREGPVRPEAILGRQGRHARLHDVASPGSRQQGHHGQHGFARVQSPPDMVMAVREDVREKSSRRSRFKRLGRARRSLRSWAGDTDEAGFTPVPTSRSTAPPTCAKKPARRHRPGTVQSLRCHGIAVPHVAALHRCRLRGSEHMASARLIKKYPNRRLYDTQTSTTSPWRREATRD